MARLNLYLDKRPAKDGRHHVKIGISHRKTTALFPTNVFVKPEHWFQGDEDTDPYIKKSCPGYKALNKVVESKSDLVQQHINALEINRAIHTFTTATSLKNHIQAIVEGKGVVSFTAYFKKHLEATENKGTKRNHTETFVKVEKYMKGRTLYFEDITIGWLTDFEKSMSKIKVNSRAIHLRNIRTIFNDALDEEVTDAAYPFRKFKIKKQRTPKRSLTIEQLKTIRDYDCEKHQRRYRDIFMLMFYLQGVNLVDLCLLKESNVVDGRIEFYRAKTARLYSIKILPEAQEIIDRYRGKDYLLNIMDSCSSTRNFLHRINDNLKEIGPVEIGKQGRKTRRPLFPKLTTYYTRHSWATFAGKLDIPKETIAAALGHGEETTTDIYIDFDQGKVDEANRMVLDSIR